MTDEVKILVHGIVECRSL